MKPEIEDIESCFRTVFPVYGVRWPEDGGEMVFVSATWKDDGLRVTMQLVAYEKGIVIDIREQELFFCESDDAEPRERLFAFIEAWGVVLGEVFSSASRDQLSSLMPHDLHSRSALRLAKAQTRADFEKALRAKSRLGGLIAQAQ